MARLLEQWMGNTACIWEVNMAKYRRTGPVITRNAPTHSMPFPSAVLSVFLPMVHSFKHPSLVHNSMNSSSVHLVYSNPRPFLSRRLELFLVLTAGPREPFYSSELGIPIIVSRATSRATTT
eukprot:751544-Hanusia_phi.AAC.2